MGVRVLLLMLAVAGIYAAPAEAASLRLQPLAYEAAFESGTKQKGFIDISNPSGENVRLQASVQAYRQTDDRGSLEFYDDPRISSGITPDLEVFDLGPREAVRMYFLIDGEVLPPGDVFAALMISTVPQAGVASGTVESVRLGTLLTLVNGDPGPREARVEALDAAWLQTGSQVKGRYTIRNTADTASVSGFFPEVTATLEPFGASSKNQAPLVMAGRQRQAEFHIPGSRLGIYKLSVRHGQNSQSRWVVAVTGYWRWLAPLIVVATTILPLLWYRYRHTSRGYFKAR